jgi:O-Antigen ligase
MDSVITSSGPTVLKRFDPRQLLRRRQKPVVEEFIPLAGYARTNPWIRNRRTLYVMLGLIAFFYGALFGIGGTYVLLPLAAPLVVMVALIIWLLPDTGHAPVDLIRKLLVAFLVVLLCWPNYLALALPGLPWITAVRLISMPMAVVMLICLSISANFRAEMKGILSATPWLWKLIVAFSAIAFLSIAVSRDIPQSLNKFIVAQTVWTLIFFASAYVFVKPGRVYKFCVLIFFCVLLVSFTAIWEARMHQLPWAGHIPSFLKVDDELLNSMMSSKARAGSGIYRAKAMSTTPLGLAELLALSTPFILHLLMTARTLIVKAAALITLPLMFHVIILTDSRLGVVGFLMTFMLYLLLANITRWIQHRRSVFAPLIVISYPAIFSAFIAATFAIRRLRVMVWGGGATNASSEARNAQIREGIPKIITHPWGFGIGQGARTLGWTNQAGTPSIDSYLLLVGLEYGVIGFVIFVGMFAAAVLYAGYYATRTRDPEIALLTPLAISLANFFLIKSIFAQEANHPLVFAMLGMIAALVYRLKTEPAGTATEPGTKPGTKPATGPERALALPARIK